MYKYAYQLLDSMFFGLVCASILYGVACVQALYYFTSQNDKWPLKLLVSALMVLDTVHQAFITHTVYVYTVARWGIEADLAKISSSMIFEVFFGVFIAMLVQSFMATRIWRLTNGSIILIVPVALFAIGEFVSALVYTIRGLPFVFFHDMMRIRTYVATLSALAATCDVYITIILCILLHRSRSGLRRSDTVINRLITLTVNTGLLTSLCAIFVMATMLGTWAPFSTVPLYFVLGRFYTNTLLATLNSRDRVRNAGANLPTTTNNFALSLSNFSVNGITSGSKDASGKIDSSTDTTSNADEERGPDNNNNLRSAIHFDEKQVEAKTFVDIC